MGEKSRCVDGEGDQDGGGGTTVGSRREAGRVSEFSPLVPVSGSYLQHEGQLHN